jgi:serine/threonine protein kinase
VYKRSVETSSGNYTPIGDYLLGNKLATGGMGEVYVGVKRGIGDFKKPLALKLLLPHLTVDERAVKRFLDEARLSAQLNHPNIAQVFDVAFADGRYFFAMELVRGVSLASLLATLSDKSVSPSAEVIAHLGRSICDGLAYAHALKLDGRRVGLIHRDMSPHNVLISYEGAVKITDFGIAQSSQQTTETSPGFVLGKITYMAPEQRRGLGMDHRADLFSAAATLYQFSSVQRKLEPVSIALERRLLPPLSTLRPDLPEQLVAAIARGMSLEPDKRFDTARAFREALPAAESGADELAVLVNTHCAAQLGSLDALTQHHSLSKRAARRGNTASVSARVEPAFAGPGTASLEVPAQAATFQYTKPLIALGAALCVLLFGWMWWPTDRPRSRATTKDITDIANERMVFKAVSPVDQPAVEKVENEARRIADEESLIDLTPAGEEKRPTPASVAPTPVGETIAKKRPKPQAVPRTTPRPAPPKTELAHGFVSIDATPWARVSIDGQPVGETPLAAFPLSPGKHRVLLANPDSHKSEERTVVAEPNKTKFIKVDLN